jgi:signal transduction histidine kinase
VRSGEQEQQSGKIRLIVFVCLAGLLLCVIAASTGALAVLRELHAQEERIRRTLAARSAFTLRVSSSTQIFNEIVLQRVLAQTPEGGAGDRAEIDRLATEVSSTLQRYPAGTNIEEREELEAIQRLVARQQHVFGALASSRAAASSGTLLAVKQLAPLRYQIVESSEKFQLGTSALLEDAQKTALGKFEDLRSRLTRLLVVALGSGFLLAAATTVYIGRLERQVNRRYRELVRSRDQLQRLSARLVDAQELERRSISRELHDEVGQSLGALLVDLGRVASQLPHEQAELKGELCRMKGVTEQTVRAVRQLSLLLRPAMLDDLGLTSALEWLGREISRQGNMEVEVHNKNVSDDLPDEHTTCIYRLVQEALNNAARHANARHADVWLERTGDRITVSIRDNGHGFSPERSRGMGILGMEERLKNLGGSLMIQSEPGSGTIVTGSLPLDPDRRSA